MNEIRHFLYWLEARKQKSGLKKLEKDDRDLTADEVLGGWFGSYTPQAQIVRLVPTFTKNQKSRSNCSFQSWSNSVAVSLAQAIGQVVGEEISARGITAKAFQQKLCGVDGWADIRSGIKVAQKFGVVLEKDCPSDEGLSWADYVNVNFNLLDQLASERKVGLYYQVRNSDEYLRAIDNGHAVVLGRTWLSGMNQGGGFSAPWILPRKGYTVGGHATCGVGYRLNYYGNKVSDELNSYGDNWGDNGHFYCPLSDLNSDIIKFGAYAISDMVYNSKMTAEQLTSQYEGKNVRGNKRGAIAYISDGVKKEYVSDKAFLAWNGFPFTAKNAFSVVPQESYDAVPYSYAKFIYETDGKNATLVSSLKEPVNNNFKEVDATNLSPGNLPVDIANKKQ